MEILINFSQESLEWIFICGLFWVFAVKNASTYDSKNVYLHFKFETPDTNALPISGPSSKFSFVITIFYLITKNKIKQT